MFGRKKEIIENLESLTDKLCSEVDFLKLKLSRRNETIAELEQTIKHQKKALQSKPSADVLDKMRDKIMQLDYDIESVGYDYNDMSCTEEVHMICREEVVRIIDEYKAESEGAHE